MLNIINSKNIKETCRRPNIYDYIDFMLSSNHECGKSYSILIWPISELGIINDPETSKYPHRGIMNEHLYVMLKKY